MAKPHPNTEAHHPTLEEKKKLLSESELSIWLDTYDDIFSDFDSRPLSERVLSDDFINEAKKMAREKPSGDITLKLLMSANLRKKELEDIVIKSLHTHFYRYADQLKKEISQSRKRGLLSTIVGLIIIVAGAYLIRIENHNFLIDALRITMEPAGWFFTWSGFDNMFYSARSKKPEVDFASRMAHAEITFLSF